MAGQSIEKYRSIMSKPRTLICRLKGGLGNQLFQYACAVALSKRFDARLAFDASILTPRDAIGRRLELNRIFDGKVVEEDALPSMPLVRSENPAALVAEVGALYASGASAIVLDGYFQEENFFLEVGAEIKSALAEFRQRYLAGGTLPKQSSCTVGLHLRRHDYQHLGLCADSYYIESINWFNRKYGGDVQFFVFTDEPLYTSDLLRSISGQARVSIVNTGDHLADFLLLSFCDHFVIANSTYSWWAAYLGEKNESIVFAPTAPWVVGAEVDPAPTRWCKVAGVVSRNQWPTDVKDKIRWARFSSSYYKYQLACEILGKPEVMRADPNELFPCLDDEVNIHPVDAHYLYHPAWAARKLLEYGIKEHYDFGSTQAFAAMTSAFTRVVLHDFRMPHILLSGLVCRSADLMKLDYANDSLPSVSCMHTIEHVGLGRYGDTLNPEGDRVAAKELVRVLQPGGTLIFVVPVGRSRLQFNGHRIYSFEQVLDMLQPLELLEHSLIPDTAFNVGMIDNASPEIINQQVHGCGCFVFRKLC